MVDLSAHLCLLLLLVAYIYIFRGLLPKFKCVMFNNLAFAMTTMNWSWKFLFHHSQFQNHKRDHVAENGKELSIRCYEGNPGSEEAAECAVCLCKVEQGDEIRELRCDHLFHRVCLDRWVGYKHQTCPLCRGSLAPCRKVTELGEEEVLFFNFCSFRSSDRSTWWLR